MNRSLLIFVVLVFSPFMLIGQNLFSLSVEELESMLDTLSVDRKLKVDVCNELAYKLRDLQTEKAKYHANYAISLADSLSYLKGKGYSLVTLGLIAKRGRKNNLAEDYFLDALTIRKKIRDTKGVASVYNNLGLLFQGNNSIKSQKYYETGLSVLDIFPHASIKATIHNNYGSFLTQEENFNTALLHLDSSLVIRKARGSQKSLGNCYLNLASFYFEIDDSSQFNLYIDSSLFAFTSIGDRIGKAKNYNLIGKYAFSKKQYGEAQIKFEQAVLLAENSSENKYRFLRNLAAVEIRKGNFDKALKINNTCIAYFELIKNDRETASLLINNGTIFYEQSEYSQAVDYYRKAIDKLSNINDVALESKALLFLSASYGYLGRLKEAADISVQYLQIRDRYFQQKNNTLNSILDEKKLLVQNAQLKIEEVSNKLELEKKHTQTMRMYMLLGGGVIFFLFLIAASSAAIYKQKKQIADLVIDDLLAENERKTNYARLEEQESERNRIARDLHDRLGSMFTAIKFSLGSIESEITNIKEENKSHYNKVNNLIDDACDEVRNIAHDLRNSTLANFGLKIALESLVESINGKNLKVILQTHNLNVRLNNKIEVNVYQIIQELISNTMKHAKAKKLTIQLNRFDDLLNITVEDDGLGFIREKTKMGMGLMNIETRVYGLQGKFNLDSGKKNGTTVMIDIPLLSNEQ